MFKFSILQRISGKVSTQYLLVKAWRDLSIGHNEVTTFYSCFNSMVEIQQSYLLAKGLYLYIIPTILKCWYLKIQNYAAPHLQRRYTVNSIKVQVGIFFFPFFRGENYFQSRQRSATKKVIIITIESLETFAKKRLKKFNMQKNKNASRSLSKWFFPPELQKKNASCVEIWYVPTYSNNFI